VVLAEDTTAAAAVVALAEFFSQPQPGMPAGVKPE